MGHESKNGVASVFPPMALYCNGSLGANLTASAWPADERPAVAHSVVTHPSAGPGHRTTEQRFILFAP